MALPDGLLLDAKERSGWARVATYDELRLREGFACQLIQEDSALGQEPSYAEAEVGLGDFSTDSSQDWKVP